MSRASIAVLVALATSTGCLYKETGRKTLPRRTEPRPATLQRVELAGTVTVDDGGAVNLAIAMRGQCEQQAISYEQIRISTRKDQGYLVANLVPSGVLGAYSLGGGIALLVFSDDETAHTFGTLLVATAAVLGANILRSTVFTSRTRSRIKSRRLGEETTVIECPARLAEEALARLPPEIVATTPWGIEHRVRVTGRTATFAIDWGKSRIDPLSPDAESRVRQPWSFTASDGTGQTTWSPDQASAEAALIAIGRATGTDLAAAAGEAPPLLVIEQLDTRGPLPAGRATRTSLTIANKGRGGAYRVVAATKSSDPALHGLRYSFGKIGPGESITKYTEVTIPREHEDGKALVVVTVSEANNNVPDRYSKEVDIAHAGRPRLDVACAVSEGSTSVNETRTVDAGRQLRLRCTVTNRGDGPAVAAQVEAALGSGNGRPSTTADIPAGGKVALDVLLQVPSDVRTGESLTLTATARETDFGDSARWSLPVEVGLMQICQPPMKRDAYERKLAEIKSMGLDAATLRAYQEQLVACLAP